MTATPSDTVLTALMVLGGILLFLGAFYTRITKVEFFSSTAQLGAFERVVRRSVRTVRRKPGFRQKPPLEQVEVEAEAARKAATAWVAVQTKPAEEAKTTLADMGLKVDEAEVDKLRRGTPSSGFWDQLADAALREQESQEGSANGPPGSPVADREGGS